MKTLINKHNPALRITAPEIEEYEHFYSIPNWYGFSKPNWILVEEEPIEGITGNLEEIPSNVDLEEEIYKWLHSIAGYNNVQIPVTFDDIENTARHFYELGRSEGRLSRAFLHART